MTSEQQQTISIEQPLRVDESAWTEARDASPAPNDTAATDADRDILYLAELLPIVRQRLDIDDTLPDGTLLASLATIAACSSPRERWRAAFGSMLGHWLALKGRDLNTTLNTLIALLPKPHM